MEPVDLDSNTDDDHGVQENPEPVISGDDYSNMISLVLAEDIAEAANMHDVLSSFSDEKIKEDTQRSVSTQKEHEIIDDRMSKNKRMNETTEPELQ
eukprot:10526889-Ditylum_brightwellii.AAC.1